MSRRPRIKLDSPIAYYHVMTRTAQQEMYLSDTCCPGFKETMLQIFKDMAAIYYVNILAWVIMDNHYHLCLEVQQPQLDPGDLRLRFDRLQKLNKISRRWQPELVSSYYERFTDLSRFMSSVNSRTAKAFNRIRDTKGHLWGGRYQSKVIENDAAVLRVMTYIEHNPVKAKLSKTPSAYPWCSAGYLKNNRLTQDVEAVPAIDFLRVLEPEQRASAYIEWVDDLAIQLDLPAGTREQGPGPAKNHLNNHQLTEWRCEFAAGEPENWSIQGFGSRNFQQKITLAEKTKTRNMTKRRSRELKRRRFSEKTIMKNQTK